MLNKLFTISALLLSSTVYATEQLPCTYLEGAEPLEQYYACPASKTAALNAVISKIGKGQHEDVRDLLVQFREKHPEYSELVEISSGLNALTNEQNPLELVAVLSKLKLHSMFKAVEVEPFNQVAPIPLEVPPLSKFTSPLKDEYETSKMFAARIEKANEKRNIEISFAKEKFRSEVSSYNKAMSKYKSYYEEVVNSHKQSVRSNTAEIIRLSFDLVLGQSVLKDMQYLADLGKFVAELKFSNVAETQQVVLDYPNLAKAKDIKNALQNSNDVSVELTEKNGFLEVENILVATPKETYAFRTTDEKFSQSNSYVAIDEGDQLLISDGLKLLEVDLSTLGNEQAKLALEQLIKQQKNSVLAFNKKLAGMSKFAISLVNKMAESAVIKNSNAVAVIVGNRNYSTFGNDISDVDFAINDARLMKEYVENHLGYDEENIIYIEDATKVELERVFGSESDPVGKLSAYVTNSKTKVFVYYSGHGTLGPESRRELSNENAPKRSYMVPVNGTHDDIFNSGYRLDTLYANLNGLQSADITVVVDACFSGGFNNGTIVKGASALFGKPQDKFEYTDSDDKLTIFSASGKGEMASWDMGNRLGVFTKRFIQGVTGDADFDDNSQVSSGELYRYLMRSVSNDAAKYYNNRQQNPQFKGRKNKVVSTL